MSTIDAADADAPAPTWRIAPSVPVAIGVFIAYVAAFIGLSSSSGIPFDDWFISGANLFRCAVIPLIGGSLVLIVFLLWARWDFVFTDPQRLPMPRLLNVLLVLYILVIITQFAIAGWSRITLDWLLAAAAAGILVGFAEETLFRGIVLRSLRTHDRPEAWVLVISSLWFGFMHLSNVANGFSLGSALLQSLFATMSGVIFYLFRRTRGLLVFAMVAHGLFDMSKFLPDPTTDTMRGIERLLPIVFVVSALVAVTVIVRRDRSFTVTRAGVQQL